MVVNLGLCNKSQTKAIESILLGGTKKILGRSSKMCNEAVWGDLGLVKDEGIEQN